MDILDPAVSKMWLTEFWIVHKSGLYDAGRVGCLGSVGCTWVGAVYTASVDCRAKISGSNNFFFKSRVILSVLPWHVYRIFVLMTPLGRWLFARCEPYSFACPLIYCANNIGSLIHKRSRNILLTFATVFASKTFKSKHIAGKRPGLFNGTGTLLTF